MQPGATGDPAGPILIILLLIPLLIAFVVSRWPAGGAMLIGVVMMFASYALVAMVPLLAIAGGTVLFTGGVIVVAIGGLVDAVTRSLARAPGATAEHIDDILSERARQRRSGAPPG